MSDSSADRFVRTHLKTRHLVLLHELGRHGSILHAAQAANLSQPAASKLLSELEYVLGVSLFDRQARGVQPTWYGEILIRRAGAALAEMDAAHQEVMQLLSGMRGRVMLGSVITPSTSIVPLAVSQLKREHPRIQVNITVDTSKIMNQRLRNGELDIVIGRILDSESAAELNFEALTDEPHSLIVRKGHPLLSSADLSLSGLAAYPWILPPGGSILRDRLTALFLSQGLDQPEQTIETMSVPVITSLLMQTDMLVALPEQVVKTHLDAGILARLDFDLGIRMDSYGIITRKNHQLSPGALQLIRILRASVTEIRAEHHN